LQKLFKYLFLLIFSFGFGSGKATHIVGGELTYKNTGTNVYKIRLDLYIDCLNGNAGAISSDAQAIIGIFNGNTKRILNGYPISVSRKGPVRVNKTNYNCIAVSPNACVDHYIYETTVTLPPITDGYYISFQRCCRNGTISNIVDPGAAGANYWAYIPDSRLWGKENTSAVFNELPPNFLCTNTPLKFDHSAKDADGDSLVYELITPYTGANQFDPRPDNTSLNGYLQEPLFTQISWNSGYSALNPIDGNPKMTIDPVTGYLTLVPTKVGQFVVGIVVKEYRKGKLVTQTIRDYQFNVQSCVIDVVASYFVPKVICGLKYQFVNQSNGATRYHWDFGIKDSNKDTSNLAKPQFTYPKAGVYKVRLYAYKNKCLDSFSADITVVEPTKPKLPKDTILCPGDVYKLKSNIVADFYSWSTGSQKDSILVTKDGTYWLGVTVKSCTWFDTINITYDRNVIKAFGDTVFCNNDPISHPLKSLLTLKSKYSWNTNETTQNIIALKPGKFIVSGITENGCKSKDTVEVSKFTPVNVSIRDTIVCPLFPITFDSKNTNPAAIINWSNGATGNTMVTNIPQTYFIRVKIGLCDKLDTFVLTNYKREYYMGNDLRYCNKIDTLLTLNFPNISKVVWNNEVPGPQFQLTKPGVVTATWLNSNNCQESDSIYVNLFPNPKLNLGPDTILCLSEKPILDAGAGMQSYFWYNGITDQMIVARDSGLYWVEVKDWEGCKSRDSVLINKRKDLFTSLIFMPNAFTPNDDGLNDLYPTNQYKVKGSLYNLKLYNRWGEKLVDYSSPDFNWDGKINGVPASEGVYVYKITWIGCDNYLRTLVGDFTLLR
jgi:hypothetical protein